MGSSDAAWGTPETRFNAIYDQHHRAVHAYLLARTSDPEAALDLLQETFLRAWRNLDTLGARGEGRHRYWIFTVARNLVTDYYRARAARSTALEQLSADARHHDSASETMESALEEREEVEMLDRAIKQLPEELRTVLLLQTLGELTSAQIGEALGKPAGTIRYQTSQARKQLAQEMHLIKHDDTMLEARP